MEEMIHKVFLVEDDQNFGAVLKSYLEIHNYEVVWVDDGADALKKYQQNHFDICILDVMLPNIDGFEIARQIRKIDHEIPLIFLTAKTLKEDILQGFQLGADDYITKPFDSEVLLYKIQAILRRNTKTTINNGDTDEFEIGKFVFNYPMRLVKDDKTEKKLSPKEADLLKLLCSYKNEILPREVALKSIWGDDNYFTTRSMDVYITKLRKYLKSDKSIEILNVHGAGYRLLLK